MGPYHFIIGSLMEPEDDLTQRLRKYTTALFFIPGSLLSFIFVITTVLALDGSTYSTGRLIQNTSQAICGCVMYGWMRKTRHVTGLQGGLLCWWSLLSYTPSMLLVPGADTALWAVVFALLSVFLWSPRLPAFLTTCLIYALVGQWNVSHVTNEPELLLVLPGYVIKDTIAGFTDRLSPTLLTAVVITTFIAVIAESERRGKAQKAANQMTLEILQLQRRYNTTKIAEVIEECKTAGVVDAELLTLFANMNSNLESYRPFLPNYLFNDTDDEDEGNVSNPAANERSEGEDGTEEGALSVSRGASSRAHRSNGSSTYEGSSVAGRNGSNLRPVTTTTCGLMTKRGDLYNGRVTFALVDVNAERLAPSDFGGKTSDVLKSVVHMIYTLAKETKASVHSMLGDTVQLTWNATSNVVLPESKGAVFLARLVERFQMPEPLLPSASRRTTTTSTTTTQVEEHEEVRSALPVGHPPVLSLRAAICSGRASAHSLTANNQQALLIEAAWLPTLEACFDLAKRVGRAAGAEPKDSSSSIVLMDDRTAKACHLEVEAAAVEVVQLSHHSPNLRPTFLGHYAADLEIGRTTFARSTASTSTVIYQLLKEHQRADDEWMYQIQHGATEAEGNETNPFNVHLKALALASQDQLAEALQTMNGTVPATNTSPTHAASHEPESMVCPAPMFIEALRAKCGVK